MTRFPEEVVTGVTTHMNGDHADDNLLIAKAFGFPEATASQMVGVTGSAGVWSVTDASGEHELAVNWPGGVISERPEVRREVVALYQEACARLGVPARESESHPADESAANDSAESFSTVLRTGSWADHSDSEGASFMEDIMRGQGTLQDYVDLVAQHYFMYEALEAAADTVAQHPAFVGFHPAALTRLPALVADLEHLVGGDWRERIAPVPATAAYAARIREVADEGWIAGVVAHHYTRYLGDLSGGQIIAKRVAKQHGLERAGIAFYDFAELGSLTGFKDDYRAALDRLGDTLDESERARMLDEVRTAYAFNTAVFVDLGRAKAGVA